MNLGVRHVLKRVTRRDQAFRLHAIVELLPCMEWKRQCPLPLAIAVSLDVFVARLIGSFSRVEVRIRDGGFRAASGSNSWRAGHLSFAVYGGLRR